MRHVGASFETIGLGTENAATANEVTPGDLVALSTFSVAVKGTAAVALLESDLRLKVSNLLSQIPQDLTLVDPEAASVPDDSSVASELWRLVRTVPGFGPTRTSKLLARKRPHLLPIYDSVIGQELGLKDSTGHWKQMRDLVTRDDNAIYQRALRLRAQAGLDSSISALRVIDIVLWRHGMDVGRVPAEED